MTLPDQDSNTVSVAAIIDLVDELTAIGTDSLDPDEKQLLHKILSSDLSHHVPRSEFFSVWAMLEKQNSTPELGLLLGQKIHPGSKGVLASWVSQASTIGEALDIFVNNTSLMNTTEQWHIDIDEHNCSLLLTFNQCDNYPIRAIERSMSAMVAWANALSGKTTPIYNASFTFSRPSYINAYESLFGKNLTFSSANNALILPSAFLETPIITSSQLLKEIAEKQAKDKLITLQGASETSDKVRRIILKQINNGSPLVVDEVSRRMHISRQTLYRRLQAEGTSYKEIVDNIRKQKVRQKLESGKHSLTEISYELGFKDTSSFYKAFKRWFGVTPAKYDSH